MGLKRRDVLLAAVLAFVAWGYLTHWTPLLRFLGYAFVLGAVAAFACVILTVSLSIQSRQDGEDRAIFNDRFASFVAEDAWRDGTAWLREGAKYERKPLLPSSFVVSENLNGLLDLILRDFVSSWYRNITRSPNFVNGIDEQVRDALAVILRRLNNIDVVEAAVTRWMPIITNHIKEFHEAELTVRGKKLNRNITESEELDLAVAGKYRDGKLHPAASLAYSDLKLTQQDHLRRMFVRLMPQILPTKLMDSRAVAVLVREIVSCAVLTPLMQLLSDPDIWNQIVEAVGRTMLQDRKTVKKLRAALDEHAIPPLTSPKPKAMPRLAPQDDDRKFERFIRSIRQCTSLSDARRMRSEIVIQLKRESMGQGSDKPFLRRLETGKRMLDLRIGQLDAVGSPEGTNRPMPLQLDTKHLSRSRLEDTNLRQILYDTTSLSYFMEYMDRHQKMSLVQFWIVVDGFRNPLEEDVPDENEWLQAATHWQDSDRTDIAQIAEGYLSKSELKIPPESHDTVDQFLQAGFKATPRQYSAARSAILRAQTSIYEELSEKYFPRFKKSDLWYKLMAADGSSTKAPKLSARVARDSTITPILESPMRSSSSNRSTAKALHASLELKRNAASSSDLQSHGKLFDDHVSSKGRRSLDVDTSGPLFQDDIEPEEQTSTPFGMGSEILDGEDKSNEQIVEAVEAALNDIMTDEAKDEDSRVPLFGAEDDGSVFGRGSEISQGSPIIDSQRRSEDGPSEKRTRPNLASLGLVAQAGRIGVFTDNDLFGDEEKFIEDEYVDTETHARDRDEEDEIHQAAPGDLGLAEAITALTNDIDRLVAQDSVVDALHKKAELTNNVAELRILGKSKASLQREIRRKEMQRQQYIIQESDNSLYGRASISIPRIMVGKDADGQEFALYVVEVHREAGENMGAASWAVMRRFSEFHDLHHRLRNHFATVRNLDFPRRHVVMKLQRDFLHKRRVALEAYLRELLRLPAVCRSRAFRSFLSQRAIVSNGTDSNAPESDRRDIITRIYNSVTDGMDEFLGNIPVLDQLSVAGQNLITAATSQYNSTVLGSHPPTSMSEPADVAESIVAAKEAQAELEAFDSLSNAPAPPFVKPVSDIFLELFELNKSWLRGRAVVVVLHQLLGGTVERKIRDTAKSLTSEESLLRYLNLARETIWEPDPATDGATLKQKPRVPRSNAEKAKSRREASVILATLLPDLAGGVVGRSNAQAAARRVSAVLNNGRLMTHLVFTMLDRIVDVMFPDQISFSAR